jgi:hypothetical protein
MKHIDLEIEEAANDPFRMRDILSTERNAHGLSKFTLKKYAISPKRDCIHYIRITRSFMYLFEKKRNLEN